VSTKNITKALTLFLLSIGLASATPILGTLNFTGGATVSLLALDFAPTGGGTGSVRSIPGAVGNTGSFSGLTDTSVGTILDRTEGSQPAGVPLLPPNGINNYLVFSVDLPSAIFRLDFVEPGTFTSAACSTNPALAAPQQTCTPPPVGTVVSPYNLTNFLDATGGISSSAAFSVRGTVLNSLTGEVSNFNGRFTATFDRPFQSLLADVLGGGTVTTPFSARFNVTAIPEPSTLVLVFAGVGLLAFGSKYRN